jgi:hypothetical protein
MSNMLQGSNIPLCPIAYRPVKLNFQENQKWTKKCNRKAL